ncbi:MAG TPA: DPP IV N-terminal domain-containing protein, partial [Pyrinomonadaceae bacterium]|nr:DPP IV N-terminal domain-containing protein [Pyrinomonadaceae bacterium]
MAIQDRVARFAHIWLEVVAVCLCCVSAGLAQTETRQLTLEWIFGPEGRSVASVPATAWLDDGSLMMLDNRRPLGERTFERLDPATGRREPAVDAARALTDLRTTLPDSTPQTLAWPIAFDGAAQHALYVFKGDIFVLELTNSRFRRLTNTPAEETSAGFSPNGRRVSYVRANDLYCYDLDAGREIRITRDGSDTLLNGTLSWVYWEEVFGR